MVRYFIESQTPCETCKGTGLVEGKECKPCRGIGSLTGKQEVEMVQAGGKPVGALTVVPKGEAKATGKKP